MSQPIFKLLARVDHQFVPVRIKKEGKKEIPIPVEGATSYYVRFTENGKRAMRPLGKDFAYAVGSWRTYVVRAALQENDFDLPQGIPSAEHVTLTEARDKYFADRQDLDVKSVQTYRLAIDGFISSCRKTYIEDVDAQDMKNFMNWLSAQPMKKRKHSNPARTRANRVGHVAIFLKKFGREKLLKKSEYPKFHEKKIVAHPDEELSLLYGFANPEEQFLLDFFIGSMAREAEASNCRYEDLTGTTLTIYGKQHKTRTVEISPRLAAAIRERREESKSEYLFPNGGGKPNQHLLRDLQHLANKAGAKFHTELHKLRKTGASRRYRNGELTVTLMRELGHGSLDITEKYLCDVRPEEAKKAVALSDFVPTPQIVRTGTGD